MNQSTLVPGSFFKRKFLEKQILGQQLAMCFKDLPLFVTCGQINTGKEQVETVYKLSKSSFHFFLRKNVKKEMMDININF